MIHVRAFFFLFQCYVTILGGDHACIGYYVAFQYLATSHLIDAYGRSRYVVSKESMFPRSTTFAVSTFFQPLLRKRIIT